MGFANIHVCVAEGCNFKNHESRSVIICDIYECANKTSGLYVDMNFIISSQDYRLLFSYSRKQYSTGSYFSTYICIFYMKEIFLSFLTFKSNLIFLNSNS